jgi:hypothetical protein
LTGCNSVRLVRGVLQFLGDIYEPAIEYAVGSGAVLQTAGSSPIMSAKVAGVGPCPGWRAGGVAERVARRTVGFKATTSFPHRSTRALTEKGLFVAKQPQQLEFKLGPR